MKEEREKKESPNFSSLDGLFFSISYLILGWFLGLQKGKEGAGGTGFAQSIAYER